MNAVLVGTDRLGNIPELLGKIGIRVANHISGRAASHQPQVAALPSSTDLLILFIDFLKHNATRSYRSRARSQRVRVVGCRRSGSRLLMEVQRLLGCGPDRKGMPVIRLKASD